MTQTVGAWWQALGRKMTQGKAVEVVRALWPLLRLYPWAVPAIVVLGLLSSLAEGLGISLFIPFLQSLEGTGQPEGGGWLVESFSRLFAHIPPERRLLVISLAIFGSVLIKAALAYGSGVLFNWLDARVSHRLRSGIFEQLLTVGYGFLQGSESGKLLNTLSNETWRTSQALAVLVNFVITLCTLVVYTTLLLLISWKLTLLVAVVMLAISLVVRLVTRQVQALGEEATQANAALASRMLEGLWAMKVIRAFGRESHEQARFDAASTRVSRTFLKLGIIGGAVNPIYEILAAALLVVVMMLTMQTSGNVAAFLVFLVLLYRLQPKVKALDGARVGLTSLAAGVEAVTSLLDKSDKPYTLSGTRAHTGLERGVTFDGVGFCYGAADKPALEDISLSIPAGKTTALVGPSGAGKSTLINLLFRFYEPTTGSILVDGRPLAELELTSWRSRIALVSQDIYLFSATVRENIAYGRPGATDEEIVRAAKLANAHDFIVNLPQGYDSPLGERGVRLSGGQQQRLTLARAIVRDPEILILDEATNALDSISESLIQEALDTLSQNRTVIVIAHRFSTIERADHIVVLEEGRVKEEGRLERLLELGGLFAKLHHLQHRGVPA